MTGTPLVLNTASRSIPRSLFCFRRISTAGEVSGVAGPVSLAPGWSLASFSSLVTTGAATSRGGGFSLTAGFPAVGFGGAAFFAEALTMFDMLPSQAFTHSAVRWYITERRQSAKANFAFFSS